jgi:carboxylesterase type B
MGNLATNTTYAWTPADYKVSATMESYFANFIKTGNPNGAALPKWNANTKRRPGKLYKYRCENGLGKGKCTTKVTGTNF